MDIVAPSADTGVVGDAHTALNFDLCCSTSYSTRTDLIDLAWAYAERAGSGNSLRLAWTAGLTTQI